jgi:hypothetical protein
MKYTLSQHRIAQYFMRNLPEDILIKLLRHEEPAIQKVAKDKLKEF